MKAMIYTTGRKKDYERYFREQKRPRKAVGGSVWRTAQEAVEHCSMDYAVYGVRASWSKDVKRIKGSNYGELRRMAELVKVPQPEQKDTKWVFTVTAVRFGHEWRDIERSPDGKFHCWGVRTSPRQKRRFRIVNRHNWGIFLDLASAKQAVAENWGDMYEAGYYPELVIEETRVGLLGAGNHEWWYKWRGDEKTGGYKPWRKPKPYRNIIAFWN